MDVFVTENGRTLVAVDLDVPKEKVITTANKHFKINKGLLEVSYGWVKGDNLYFKQKRGYKKVWVVSRK